MLDPDLVLASVVSAFRSIPEAVTALDGDSSLISGHTFSYGVENSLAKSIFAMRSPSVLVAYLDLLGGNFDGMTVWKHRLEVYLRPKSAVSGFGPGPAGCSAPHLWWLLMNKPVPALGPGTLNIRSVDLIPGLLLMDAMPALRHQQDENLADFFVGQVVCPEIGDQ